MNPGVNIQLQTVTMADVADLRRFAAGGALLICDWPEHVADTLAVLDAAGVGVRCWRFTQDPRQWPDWPRAYQQRCPWALLANEPELESWPTWYMAGCDAWGRAGGMLVEPAYSDEGQRAVPEPRHGEAVSAHVYPLGRGAANLAAVRARAGGRPVLVTEAGIAGAQQDILARLAGLGVTEPAWLYTYRARDAQAQPAYNLAGVVLNAPVTQRGAPGGPSNGVTRMAEYPGAVWVPSPNFWSGRTDQATGRTFTPTAIVLHGTAGPNAWGWFANPQSQVSAHYVVDTDGTVYQCVAEADSAWHAGAVTGTSIYSGGPNPNLWSIGIEHARDVTNTSPLTPAQLSAGLALVQYLLTKYGITTLIPHDAINVGRVCPGPGFPMEHYLALLHPATTDIDPVDQEARLYYSQRGVAVDTAHALWSGALLPLYRFWRELDGKGDPLADLVKPGPIAAPEYGTVWGGTRPAGAIRLTNRAVGVYLDPSGTWRPYQVELA